MAITAEKARKSRGNYGLTLAVGLPVANSQKPIEGATIVRDNAGRAVMAAAGTVGVAVGVCTASAENTATANDQYTVHAQCGVFQFVNSSTSAITSAMIGRACYAEDNDIARAVNGPVGVSYAFLGIVQAVDSAGVWVLVNPALDALTVKEITREIKQTETALLAAALTVVFTVGTLPTIARVIDGPDTDVATAWSGPSITDVKLMIGTTGDADSILASADIDAAADGRATTRTLGIAPSGRYSGALQGTLTAVGANLSVAVAGDATTRLRYV